MNGKVLALIIILGALFSGFLLSGVARVIAFFNDGKAYAWHQLNEQYTK